MQSVVFDIETTSLEAVGAGVLLCVCIRPLSTQRTRTFRIDDYNYKPNDDFGFFERQEKDLLRDVRNELSKYDLWIGHNIERFDCRFLQSRCQRMRMEWLLYPFVYDTMKAFRRTGVLTVPNFKGRPSVGLDMVTDYFGVLQEKTKVMPGEWWQTIWSRKQERIETLDKITDHCQRDVRMNAAWYPELLKMDMKGSIRRLL